MAGLRKSLMPMLITCAAAGTVLAILAPFGTDNFSAPYRFVYWIGLCLAGGVGAAAIGIFTHWRKISLRPWPAALAQSLTSSIAVSLVILLMNVMRYGMPGAGQIAQTFFYVWVVGLAISAIGALIRTAREGAQGENAAAANAARPALYGRLKPKLRRAEIYALAAEDHYVRVITSAGDDLILMRLSDAITETAPIAGLSPHRSYWVAERGVEKVSKSELILKTGQAIPISRAGAKLVKAAGWG